MQALNTLQKQQDKLLVHKHGVNSALATIDDLNAIGDLRYKCYSHAKAISPNHINHMLDKYDYNENVQNYKALLNGQLVGAVRGIKYDPNLKNEIPSFNGYLKYIEQEIGLEHPIFESCRLVIDHESKKRMHTNLTLLQTIILSGFASNSKHSITAVRAEHVSFYQKMNFSVISDPIKYFGLEVKMVLLHNPLNDKTQDYINQNFPYLSFSQQDIKQFKKWTKR